MDLAPSSSQQSPPPPPPFLEQTIAFLEKEIPVPTIVFILAAAIAIIAVVVVICQCLKKACCCLLTCGQTRVRDSEKASELPTSNHTIAAAVPTVYPVISETQMRDATMELPTSNHTIAAAVPTVYPVLSETQMRDATMERFLSNMAREKPIRFSPEHLTGFTHNFSTQLGSGAFGVVYKGQFPDGVEVAVKVLKNRSDKSVEQQFMAEVGTIGRTYHINLVRLYGFCFDKNMKALVYEYMENGSLDSLLFCDDHVVEWGKLHEIAIRTAKGIAYLHEECQQMIIHYDIKPQNVLVDANLNPKVADFGLAKLCKRERSQISKTGFKGTPGYAAPELYMPYPVTNKCDVYSFGMLLFEIVGRRRNHDASLSESRVWLPRWTWKKYEKNEIAEMVSLCGIEERDREKAQRMCLVAMWCVQYSPEGRPSMSTVVKMLEGGMEIPPPPNPFEYLEPHAPNGFACGSDDEDSTWMTKTSQPSSISIEITPCC